MEEKRREKVKEITWKWTGNIEWVSWFNNQRRRLLATNEGKLFFLLLLCSCRTFSWLKSAVYIIRFYVLIDFSVLSSTSSPLPAPKTCRITFLWHTNSNFSCWFSLQHVYADEEWRRRRLEWLKGLINVCEWHAGPERVWSARKTPSGRIIMKITFSGVIKCLSFNI